MRLHFLLIVVLFSSLPLLAQDPCPIPDKLTSRSEPTMFNTEQEQWLGDLIAARERRSLRIVEGPLNDRLQAIGARLDAAIPFPHVRFTFHLVDSGSWNAFTEIGGQVYVMRKLITSAKSEDEIAAVLGHELSHNLLHHTSATYTRYFKVILQVDHVGDKKDIEEKFHRLEDTFNRRANKLSRKDFEEREDEQQQSDLLGIYIISRAGYDPSAFAQFWDRSLELKGKTGSRLSDFFGQTDPEEKRLRGMKSLEQSLPAACRTLKHADTSGFAEWQKAVLENRQRNVLEATGQGAEEVSSVSLKLPLQPDVDELRYSPDGRFILMQDEFGVSVMDRSPLKLRFRINAEQINVPHFSADSTSLSFIDNDMRMEKWDVATGKMLVARDLWTGVPCAKAALSPDGEMAACLRWDLNIRIVSTSTSKLVYEEKFDSRNLSYWDFIAAGRDLRKLAMLRFSEDSHYFLFSFGNGTGAVELPGGKKIKVAFDVNKVMGYAFDFQGSNRVMGVNFDNPADSEVVEFPSGNVLYKMKIDFQSVRAPTRGDWALLYPLRDYPVGLFNLKENRIVLGSKARGIDLYNDEMVSERKSGEIARYQMAGNVPKLVEAAMIPPGDITRAHAFAISPDMKYLALSNSARGAVYDVATGQPVFMMHSFDSAHFRGKDLLTVMNIDVDDLKNLDLGKDKKKHTAEEDERTRSRRYFVHLDVSGGREVESRPLEEKASWLAGEYLFTLRPKDRKNFFTGRDTELQIQRASDTSLVWQRAFPEETPFMQSNPVEDTIAMQWPVESNGAKHEMEALPEIRDKVKQLQDKEGAVLIEVAQLSTGKTLGTLALDTGKGSFRVKDVAASQQYVAVGVSGNRVLVYSLADGKLVGRVFGDAPVIYSQAGLLTVRADRNKLLVFDIATMKQRAERSFVHNLVSVMVSADGKELLAFTGDQTLHRLALPTTTAQVQ